MSRGRLPPGARGRPLRRGRRSEGSIDFVSLEPQVRAKPRVNYLTQRQLSRIRAYRSTVGRPNRALQGSAFDLAPVRGRLVSLLRRTTLWTSQVAVPGPEPAGRAGVLTGVHLGVVRRGLRIQPGLLVALVRLDSPANAVVLRSAHVRAPRCSTISGTRSCS